MLRTATNQTHLNLLGNLGRVSDRATQERARRIANSAARLSFGVSFLDDALGGIFPNDLLVVGAKTGFGKSQLAVLTALHNARQGKQVHFFALEAEEYEIERRIKYQLIADAFFVSPSRPSIHLNYMDWYYGKFDLELDAFERIAEEQMQTLSSLHVYYRTTDFTAGEFERVFLGVKNETDLVICDHLHYFDHEDENENRAIKAIVKKIRDCALIAGKPVMLIAHVRKSDKRMKQLIPDIEDFHGSSDIGKIATKAITLAPSFDDQTSKHRGTYMQVLKCRADGTRAHAVGLTAYNFASQRYERDYYLGKLSTDGTEFVPFNLNEMPFWAKSGKSNGERSGSSK